MNIQQRLAWYNMLPNFLWSAIGLAPVSIYCYTILDHRIFFFFLIFSLVPLFIKNHLLDKIQSGKTIRFYRKFGVHTINKFVQNGGLINALMKKKFPDHKIVSVKPSSVSKLIARTYIFEKFHLVLFLFFSMVMINALFKRHFLWAIVILFTNILYNIYPNLLQQYIRLKLNLYRKMKAVAGI